jgi:hypothetical protein
MQFDFGFGNVSCDAVISEDGNYRYMLSRQWSDVGKTVGFVCLNPSTADSETDDNTVRRCINFAKLWGGNRLLIGNLFAYRSTDPLALRVAIDAVGQENDRWLSWLVSECDIVVAAWGVHGDLNRRNEVVRGLFPGALRILKLTKHGHPAHPLYLPKNLFPREW